MEMFSFYYYYIFFIWALMDMVNKYLIKTVLGVRVFVGPTDGAILINI